MPSTPPESPSTAPTHADLSMSGGRGESRKTHAGCIGPDQARHDGPPSRPTKGFLDEIRCGDSDLPLASTASEDLGDGYAFAMTSSRRLAGNPTKLRVRFASALCSLVALLLVVLGWSGLIFVLGALVLPPWLVGAGLCGVSVVLSVVNRRLALGEDDQEASPGSHHTALVRRVTTTLAVGGCVFAFLGDAAVGATYTVLEPSASNGCRAVARESSFLMAGGGQVYSVHPVGVGWRAGSWTADDGIRPIGEGQYELSWGVGGGVLLVQGDGHNPVYPSLHEVTCY